jgi:hypothetical protein
MPGNPDQPERPRAEPEILPPERGSGRPDWPPFGYQTSQRIFVGRIGPLGFGLMILMVGLFAAAFLVILIGTALLWIPIAAAIFLVAAVAGLLRRR